MKFQIVPHRRWLRRLCLTLLPLLASCGHTPVTQTLAEAFGKDKSVADLRLNPQFRYLRVSSGSSEALMVLGYTSNHPLGVIETWYSSTGEVLQLQAGRIVSTYGLRTDWHAVLYKDLPSWAQLMNLQHAGFGRTRDEMPGFKFGTADIIIIRAVSPPKDANLKGVDAASLLWFEEVVEGQSSPSARYGLQNNKGEPQVIYGEQCLSSSLCIAWQAWPVRPSAHR